MDRINDFSGGLAVRFAVSRPPKIDGKTTSSMHRTIEPQVAGITVSNLHRIVSYFPQCSIQTNTPLGIKLEDPYFKQAEPRNRGRFSFTKDTPFSGNEKGCCSMSFHSQLSSIIGKRERNQWLNNARSSIRGSGLTTFAKIIEQGDANHNEFEKKHQFYVEALLEVNDSSISVAGKGVFARKRLKKGTFLGFYAGQQVASDSELSSEQSSYVFGTVDENIIINGHPEAGGGILSRVNSPTTFGLIHDGIKLESGETIDDKVNRELSKINVEAIPIEITVAQNRYYFVGYFASKQIPKGQELFLDYGKAYWEHLQGQQCHERHEAVKAGTIKSIQLGGMVELDGKFVNDPNIERCLMRRIDYVSEASCPGIKQPERWLIEESDDESEEKEFMNLVNTDGTVAKKRRLDQGTEVSENSLMDANASDGSAESSDDEGVLVISQSPEQASSASSDEWDEEEVLNSKSAEAGGSSVSEESGSEDDDCVVLVPKWEAKHTLGDGNCFFHALGKPDGDTYKLDDVLVKKQEVVTALNNLLDTINSPDVSNDALLAYAYYEQMMVTLLQEFRGHGMSQAYYAELESIVSKIGLQAKIEELDEHGVQLEEATRVLKAAIKTWKGPENHTRIDEDLNRYIDDLSRESNDMSDACRRAKEKLDVYKTAGSAYLGIFNGIVNDRDIRTAFLNATIGKHGYHIMNSQMGLSILGLKCVTGEDRSVCLHMGGLDNSGERESLFLPKICMEQNTVGKWKFRDPLLSEYLEWADTFKPCFDGDGHEGRFHLEQIRESLLARQSSKDPITERHIKITGGERGNHYEAMECVLVPEVGRVSAVETPAGPTTSNSIDTPKQPDKKDHVWGDLTRGVCDVPHPAELVNNPNLSKVPEISSEVWNRAMVYLKPLLEEKVLSNVQADAVLAMLESSNKNNPFLLGDSPGLGKTRQTLVYLCIQYQSNQKGPFFFVAPNERILDSQESDLDAILAVFRENSFKLPPIQRLYQRGSELHINADMGICLQTTGRMSGVLAKLKSTKRSIQSLVVDEVHTVTGSLRPGKKKGDGSEETRKLLEVMLEQTEAGQVVFVSGTPFTIKACKIMFPLLGINSKRWDIKTNLTSLRSLMDKGQYCRREMAPMASFSFCKLGGVEHGYQATTVHEVEAASILSGMQETPIQHRLHLVQAEQHRLRKLYSFLNAKGRRTSNQHLVALFRRVKDEEKLLWLILKLNQSDVGQRHCIYSEGVDDYQGTKDGISKIAKELLDGEPLTVPEKSELRQLMKTTYELQHPERLVDEFLNKSAYHLIKMDDPDGFQDQWCAHANGVLILNRKHVTGFDGLQVPFLDGTDELNTCIMHVLSVPIEPVSLYQLKGRLERNGVAKNRLHVVCYVLKEDSIGDMKDMVGMSDQMRELSVLMDGSLNGWVKQYLGWTHLWRTRSKQKQNDHSQYINDTFGAQLKYLGIESYQSSRDFLYRLEMHPNRAEAIRLFNDMERELIAREQIEEVTQMGDAIRVNYSVNDVTSSIVFRDIEIQGRSFISIDWYSPELAEFVKKTSRLFGFEGRWLKRGDGFELFDVMESTYRDALLEVYRGKGRCILELYLGASDAVQKQILVSIDKASKRKKRRLGKKRVQAQPSSDSVLTNKISGQTPIEQDPVAKKPRLAIVSDPVPQVVSGGVPADRQSEPASDPSSDESRRENQVSDELAAKRRRVEPERLHINGGPMNTLQAVAPLNFVGNLAQLVLKTVEGFTDDIDASALYKALKALVPKKVATTKPIRKEDREVDVKYSLHSAAVRGELEEVQRLITEVAEIDSTNKMGWTPLISAAKKRL